MLTNLQSLTDFSKLQHSPLSLTINDIHLGELVFRCAICRRQAGTLRETRASSHLGEKLSSTTQATTTQAQLPAAKPSRQRKPGVGEVFEQNTNSLPSNQLGPVCQHSPPSARDPPRQQCSFLAPNTTRVTAPYESRHTGLSDTPMYSSVAANAELRQMTRREVADWWTFVSNQSVATPRCKGATYTTNARWTKHTVFPNFNTAALHSRGGLHTSDITAGFHIFSRLSSRHVGWVTAVTAQARDIAVMLTLCKYGDYFSVA